MKDMSVVMVSVRKNAIVVKIPLFVLRICNAVMGNVNPKPNADVVRIRKNPIVN